MLSLTVQCCFGNVNPGWPPNRGDASLSYTRALCCQEIDRMDDPGVRALSEAFFQTLNSSAVRSHLVLVRLDVVSMQQAAV